LIVSNRDSDPGHYRWLLRRLFSREDSMSSRDSDPGPLPDEEDAGDSDETIADGAIVREVADALRMFTEVRDGGALRACLKRHGPETVDRALRRAANMTDLADADLARIDASGKPPF